MSHFTKIRTQITDRDALVQGLADVGYGQVEVHDAPQALYGYQGDQRAQTAEVVVRRKYVGPVSNDIGFKYQPDGTYLAIISEFDRDQHDEEWLGRLTQRYAYHATVRNLKEQGFDLVQEEQSEEGRIHLVLRRAV
jgi:hypothetical protein